MTIAWRLYHCTTKVPCSGCLWVTLCQECSIPD